MRADFRKISTVLGGKRTLLEEEYGSYSDRQTRGTTLCIAGFALAATRGNPRLNLEWTRRAATLSAVPAQAQWAERLTES